MNFFFLFGLAYIHAAVIGFWNVRQEDMFVRCCGKKRRGVTARDVLPLVLSFLGESVFLDIVFVLVMDER